MGTVDANKGYDYGILRRRSCVRRSASQGAGDILSGIYLVQLGKRGGNRRCAEGQCSKGHGTRGRCNHPPHLTNRGCLRAPII